MLGASAYVVIFLVALAGLYGVHWYMLIVGACALALIGLIEHRQYRARFAAVRMADVFYTFALSNVGTGFVAAAASYALGRVVGFVMLS